MGLVDRLRRAATAGGLSEAQEASLVEAVLGLLEVRAYHPKRVQTDEKEIYFKRATCANFLVQIANFIFFFSYCIRSAS